MAQYKKGFTLVELSIVLVIIGLLIGGVLKGQSMIENAKIKKIASDMDALVAATYSYQDKFNALPGDDNSLGATATGAAACNATGNGDGLFVPGEAICYYRDLIAEGFIAGDAAATTEATIARATPYGSFYQVRSAGIVRDATRTGNRIETPVAVVPDDVAQALDDKYDDGVAATGDFQTVAGAYGDNTLKQIAWYKF
jgi:prepilin-type N-terminal cleavage/methylation domain-containing protein